MQYSSSRHHSSRLGHRVVWLLALVTTLLFGPATLSAGVVFIPVGNLTGENDLGDRLQVSVRGEGPDLTGMTGRARFQDGATMQTTTVAIAGSKSSPGSSLLVLQDADGIPVVKIDLTTLSLTWLGEDSETTFKSGLDLVNVRLSAQSRVTN